MLKFSTSLRELCTILFPFEFQFTYQKMWTKIVQVDNEIVTFFNLWVPVPQGSQGELAL